MRFATAFALPLLLPSVAAFAIPQNQPEGVYAVHVDSRGVEVHTRLPDVPAMSPRKADPNPLLVARAARTFCGCGIVLPNGDTDAANVVISQTIGRKTNIPPGAHIYAVRGGAAAFACNYGGGSLEFAGDAIGQNNAKITAACGRYVAGTYGEPGNWASGYMRAGERGGDYCGAALGSSRGNC